MTENKTKISIFLLVAAILMPMGGNNLFPDAKVKIDDSTAVHIGSIFRSYYVNDQRLQWSGMEARFGVESALTARIEKEFRGGNLRVFSELFFNQPFDKNILSDERRARYRANFDIDIIEIPQLFIRFSTGDFSITLGKQETVFGKNHSLPLLNSYFAQPFIRTEAILRYETGLFLEYKPGILDFDLAVVNGGAEMDTNSSKAGIVRLGLDGKNWALGVSAKFQDGIGSENQKQYKNHAGLDWMLKTGAFRFCGEIIYDEYGFRKEFNEDDIFWPRSLYYRDLFYKLEEPITGIGGYVNLQYETPGWFLELNYGEFHPREIGHALHDEPVKRAIIKLRLRLAPGFHAFAMVLFENKRPKEDLFKGASDYAFLLGLRYTL